MAKKSMVARDKKRMKIAACSQAKVELKEFGDSMVCRNCLAILARPGTRTVIAFGRPRGYMFGLSRITLASSQG